MLGLMVNYGLLFVISIVAYFTVPQVWFLSAAHILFLYLVTEFGGGSKTVVSGTRCYVSGVFRQRIHYAAYLRSCPPARFAAHINHEQGHVKTHANLMRILVLVTGALYIYMLSDHSVVALLIANAIVVGTGLFTHTLLEIVADAYIKSGDQVSAFTRFLVNSPSTINRMRVEILNARTPNPKRD